MAPPHPSPAPPAPPRVLLASADALTCDAVLRALGQHFSVEPAADAAAALAAARSGAPDVLVADGALPGARSLLASLRADERTAATPVLLLLPGDEAYADGLTAGADDFLATPIRPPELLARADALQRRGRRRSAVTAREAALREEAEAARAALEGVLADINDAFVTVDPQWRYTYVNDQAAALLGRPRAALLGQPVWEIFPDSVGELNQRELDRAMREREPVSFEFFYPAWQRWYENRAYPIAEGLAVFFNDITARKQIDERLQLLQSVTARLAAAQSLAEVRRLMLGEVVRALGTESGALRLVTNEALALDEYDLGTHLSEETARRFALVPLQAAHPAAEAARTGEPVFLGDVAACLQRYPNLAATIQRHGIQASAHLPLARGAAVFGVLSLNFFEPRAWGEPEQRFARALADQAAVAYERVRLFEELQTSEERYRTLFNSTEQGFCILEMIYDNGGRPCDYRFLEVNPTFERHTGLKDAVGKTALVLVPGLEQQWIDIYGQVAATGESVRFDQGSPAMGRWFEVEAVCVGGAGSRKVALLFTDVTARRRAEAAQRASDEQSRVILESITDAFFALDRDWRFTYLNRQAERILNRQPGDLLGEDLWEAYPGLAGSKFGHAYQRAMREQIASSVTAFYPDHNRWYEVHAYPATSGITVYFRNVTEQMQAIEALRASQERYRAFVANTVEGVYRLELDPPIDTALAPDEQIARVYRDGRLAECNDAFARMYGFEQASDVVGQGIGLMLPPDDAGVRAYLHSVIENGYRAADVESAEHDRHGNIVYFANALAGVVEADRLVRVWGTQRDITDRKRAEERLRESEARLQVLYAQEQAAREEAEAASRLKDDFLATLSHELRTPLTSILGYTHLLQSRRRDEAYVARAVDTIMRSAKAQAQLIDDLLDVSRIVTGKLRLEVQPLDLTAVIAAAADAVRPALDAKAIDFQISLDPAASALVGDASRLQQVVWNLLSNAVKFTPAGGSIRVELAHIGGTARLTVSDAGQGISPEFLPHVFERFRQADSASTRSHGGLGLGLSIVRHLVEMHGGTVQAASAGLGRGATFTIHLPLQARTQGQAPSPAATTPRLRTEECPPALRGLRVLVVDDQPDIAELLREMLAACDAVVRTSTTAREALAAVEQWRPDVLVSDIAMPHEDGYWLLRQVRALAPHNGGATPAVALTAYARAEDRVQALAAGFQQYVPKPIGPSELRAVVASLAPAGVPGGDATPVRGAPSEADKRA